MQQRTPPYTTSGQLPIGHAQWPSAAWPYPRRHPSRGRRPYARGAGPCTPTGQGKHLARVGQPPCPARYRGGGRGCPAHHHEGSPESPAGLALIVEQVATPVGHPFGVKQIVACELLNAGTAEGQGPDGSVACSAAPLPVAANPSAQIVKLTYPWGSWGSCVSCVSSGSSVSTRSKASPCLWRMRSRLLFMASSLSIGGDQKNSRDRRQDHTVEGNARVPPAAHGPLKADAHQTQTRLHPLVSFAHGSTH